MEPWDYLDAALKNGPANDTEVADMIGVNKSTVSFWRSGRSAPKWDQLEKLARLAKIDKRRAVIDFAVWSSKGAAKNAAESLLKSLPMLGIAALYALVGDHGNEPGTPLVLLSVTYTLCVIWVLWLKCTRGDTQPLLKGFFTLGRTPLPGVLA